MIISRFCNFNQQLWVYEMCNTLVNVQREKFSKILVIFHPFKSCKIFPKYPPLMAQSLDGWKLMKQCLSLVDVGRIFVHCRTSPPSALVAAMTAMHKQNYQQNFLETLLKHPWNFLETLKKYSWSFHTNTIETPLKLW